MNRLSIMLAIAFVSYSLGAPENISESQSGVKNHGLEHSSDLQGLGKNITKIQDGYEDGNVNGDPSTPDPSQIDDFIKPTKRSKVKERQHIKIKHMRKGTIAEQPKISVYTNANPFDRICVEDCGSGFETIKCLTCTNRYL